jgi:hypothetical protein
VGPLFLWSLEGVFSSPPFLTVWWPSTLGVGRWRVELCVGLSDVPASAQRRRAKLAVFVQLVEACRVQASDDTEICILTVTGSYPVTVEAFVMKLRRKRVLRKRFGTANFGSVDNLCYHDRRVLGYNPLQRATPKGEDRPVCPVACQATSSSWVKIQPGITRLISAASLTLNGRLYYGWIGQQPGSGFSDIARPALGVFASLDRL